MFPCQAPGDRMQDDGSFVVFNWSWFRDNIRFNRHEHLSERWQALRDTSQASQTAQNIEKCFAKSPPSAETKVPQHLPEVWKIVCPTPKHRCWPQISIALGCASSFRAFFNISTVSYFVHVERFCSSVHESEKAPFQIKTQELICATECVHESCR